MASILDLAVIALAVMVCISMALLAWTLGVTIPAGLRRTRRELVFARLELAVAERKLRTLTGAASTASPASEGDE